MFVGYIEEDKDELGMLKTSSCKRSHEGRIAMAVVLVESEVNTDGRRCYVTTARVIIRV